MVLEPSIRKNKGPAVRRNVAARREQNRIASRNYREKRKQKLEFLHQLIDQGVDRDDALRRSSKAGSSSTSEPEAVEREPVDTSHVNPSLLSQTPQVPFDTAGSEILSLPLVKSWQESGTSDSSVLAILDGIRHLSHRQKVELMQHLQTQLKESSEELVSCHIHPAREGPGNWVSQHAWHGTTQTRLQLEARRFAAFIGQHSSGTISPARLSRIYAAESGLFGAIFANCYALGMNDVEPLMVDDGISVFCPGPDMGHDLSQLPIVRLKFVNLTLDLQPCDIQLTFGHHPYLDVLPWKTFRERALKTLQEDPALLDEDELCRDVCTGGLICWGAQQNSMGMEAGVPWDMRSWEPTVWFLKKYRSLVGGWDDDMWKCARWWHNARGQKLLT